MTSHTQTESNALSAQEGTAQRRRQIVKRSLYWLGGLLLLLMLHLWFPSLSPGTKYDTYSTSITGKKIFYLLAKEELIDVSRNDKPLSLGLSQQIGASYQTLCLLGPIRYPKKHEWEELLEWVFRGGSLVIAAHAGSSRNLKIDTLNIEVEETSFRRDFDDRIDSNLIDSNKQVYWESDKKIKASRAETILETKGGVQAVVQQHGSGKVIVIASDHVFTNESMFHEDNSLLALSFIQAGGDLREIIIDEELNRSATPKAIGLLFEIPFRPVLIQMLAMILLYCWWHHFRFGPLRPQAMSPRRNIVDHTDAVGMMYYKSQSGNAAVRAYLKQLIGQLKLRSFKGKEHRVLDPIAIRMQSSTDELMDYLTRTARAVRKTKLNRKSASEMIYELAIIRQASLSKKKK